MDALWYCEALESVDKTGASYEQSVIHFNQQQCPVNPWAAAKGMSMVSMHPLPSASLSCTGNSLTVFIYPPNPPLCSLSLECWEAQLCRVPR